jgi:hypothetical protein
MIGKVIGAAVGRRLASRHSGARGMLIGAAAPWIARRAFGPLGFALAGGWAAKKYYDSRKSRSSRGQSGYRDASGL